MAMGQSYDAIVIGGGVFGLSAALACARANLTVLVLEAGRIGQGASGGIVGAMAPHVPDQWNPKKQFQFEALDVADRYWAEVDALSQMNSGYGRIGRVMPILDEKARALAEARQRTAKDLWQGRYAWNVRESHGLIQSDHGVIEDTLSARIYPAKACASLEAALRKMGVTIVENCPVQTIEADRVFAAENEWASNCIILAAGLGGFDLLATGSGSGVKGQAALFELDLGDAPQIYSDGLYVVPHTDGKVAIGSTSENNWQNATEIDAQLDALLERAAGVLPRLKNARILQRWAGVRPKAKRRDPMIGPVPSNPHLIAALGGFKIGFGIAHKTAHCVAQIAQGKDVVIPESFTVAWHLSG